MMQRYTVDKNSYIHLPVHSGVRMSAADPRVRLLYWHPSDPVAVIEQEDAFSLITFASNVHLDKKSETCTFKSSKINVIGSFSSLREALQPYLKNCPAKSVVPAYFMRVITLDMWLSDGRIAHNYSDVLRLLSELSDVGLSQGTLLYLPGWHAPYDKGYPAYAPAEELGGEIEFYRMMEEAEKLGVTIMLHLNIWGYDTSSGILDNYEELQLRDDQGALMGWPGVTLTGSTNPLSYMKVYDERWRELFLSYVGELLRKYPLHALFLDQLGIYQGEKFNQGIQDILCAIRSIRPNIHLGSETIRRSLIHHINIFQSWGQSWCGLPLDLTDSISPIIAILYEESNAQIIGHLGLPSFVPNCYTWTNYPFIVEHGIEKAALIAQEHLQTVGGIPHIRLNYRAFGLDERNLQLIQKQNDHD